MKLGQLNYSGGAKKKPKRIGRGPGSGHGKTACRGSKGQKARSGAKIPSWFEGGQMPLQRRVPKRGFTNIFRREYQIVNVGNFNRVEGGTISPEILFQTRIIRKCHLLLKVLGEGELTKPFEVSAHAFSKTALDKIQAAGGKAIKL